MTKRIVAIIPARSGSKGLHQKNIADLAGKPLIAWTIEASLKSKYITKTIVSSDDDEILSISKRFQSDVIKRPMELAQDETASEPVIKHAIDELQKMNEIFDYIVLLQPTSPLRDVEIIDRAFDMLFESKANALISVCEIDNKILKAFKVNPQGFIEGISNNNYPFMRRQDLPKTYLSNGAIYIIATNEFVKNNKLMTKDTTAFEMDRVASLDIDTQKDLDEVKRYIV